jgi:hypothetical protein
MTPTQEALMSALSAEMGAIATQVEDLGELLGQLLRERGGQIQPEMWHTVQSADLTAQSLRAIEGVILAMASGTAPERAVGTVTLAQMQHRLSDALAEADASPVR